MATTFKAIVFPGAKHLKADGTTNIKIRVYHNGGAQYIPTHFYISPEHISNDGVIVPTCPSAELLNYDLGEVIQGYRKICIKLGTSRISKMASNELKEELLCYQEGISEMIDFVAFANLIISKTVKRKTAEWYQNSLSVLCWYFNKKKIDIKDITTSKLENLISTLAEKGPKGHPLEPGAINNYIRGIRAIYNKAKLHYNKEDYDIIRIPHDPFAKVTIPQYRRKRKNLSIDDIIRIRDHEYTTLRANMARDVFMMQFYLMGININDFFKLKGVRRGRIDYERSKTDTIDNKDQFVLSIKVEPELQALFNKYTDGEFLSYFKIRYCCLNNFLRAVNKGLKQIAQELNIDAPLSTNWARHSWASAARNKAGINKADVDFCLGHVNNDYKMADIYIEIDYSICDKANRAVIDLLQKK